MLALDILGCLPDADCCGKVEEEVYINREAIIEWIYSLQTLPTTATNDNTQERGGDGSNTKFVGGGFKGGTFLGPLPNASTSTTQEHTLPSNVGEERHLYDHSHLAMTYVALCTLVALGDDLSRIHKDAILHTLQSLQKEDGSFVAVSSVRQCQHHRGATTSPLTASIDQSSADNDDDDCDLRFMYTAIVIWYLLSDRTTSPPSQQQQQQQQQIINIEAATSYILSCISFDGAIALTPGREGHGGSTFCGIASLYLMGVLDEVMAREELAGWKDNLIRWCVMRQHSLPKADNDQGTNNNGYIEGETYTTTAAAGMQGRPNKLEDTCYSYWIGGTLHLLSSSHVLDGWALREYVLECQTPYGGFGKVLGSMPDLLHSFYSLAWLSLSSEQHCCSEEGRNCRSTDDGDHTDEEQVSDRVSSKNNGTIDAALDSEERNQMNESMNQLSRLDCALGICSKRV
jgi:geranylgeranyl transferase type-1 subunit beta